MPDSHFSMNVPGLPGTWNVWIDNTDPPCGWQGSVYRVIWVKSTRLAVIISRDSAVHDFW